MNFHPDRQDKPKTKETADHSMPYLIAYTLLYGDPTADSYSEKYLNDPSIISLIDKMDFTVTKDIDEKIPGASAIQHKNRNR